MDDEPSTKFYLASVMAVRDGDVPNKRDVYHLPTMIGPISHLAAAKTVACEFAMREFPLNDGWTDHNTAVLPVTNEVMNLLKTIQLLLASGVVVADDPTEQNERFFCGLTPTHTAMPESESVS